jgi:hypothetical protein
MQNHATCSIDEEFHSHCLYAALVKVLYVLNQREGLCFHGSDVCVGNCIMRIRLNLRIVTNSLSVQRIDARVRTPHEIQLLLAKGVPCILRQDAKILQRIKKTL